MGYIKSFYECKNTDGETIRLRPLKPTKKNRSHILGGNVVGIPKEYTWKLRLLRRIRFDQAGLRKYVKRKQYFLPN